MKDFDQFLRDIWLECCGHMSAFRDPKRRSSQSGMFDIMDAYDYLEQGDFAEYASLPVVNSPRIGVCAYEGGIIDTERDSVFGFKN